MAWWTTAIIKAAPYVYSAITSRDANDRQAGITSEYALANSMAVTAAGEYNANAALTVAALNGRLTMEAAKVENAKLNAITDYNAKKSILLGEFNADLLEDEALLVLEQADVDLAQLKREQDKTLGKIKASHGASGAIMDQDTSGAVIDDAVSQMETDQFIVRRGADIQYTKVMNQATMSRWSGYEEADKMRNEAALASASNTINSNLQALGGMAQAEIDSGIIRTNAGIKAAEILQQGMLSSDASSYRADSSYWSGMFSAGTSLFSSYMKDKAARDNSSSLLE